MSKRTLRIKTYGLLTISLIFFSSCASTREGYGKKWVVSTQGRAASQAAQEIFDLGGNSIDAAVAASLTISVERPQSTGLGGGGFMLFREGKSGKVFAIDFRERAPASSRANQFLDGKGQPIADLSITGPLAVAVPGLVQGLYEIHQRFGKLEWKKLFGPAIRLAEEGVEVYPYLEKALNEEKDRLKRFPESSKIFFDPLGNPYRKGQKIIQKDLALSLREIAETGPQAFYQGRIARAIVRTTNSRITEKDLRRYEVRWIEPLRGQFLGREIYTMPPPSSGGVHLLQLLKLAEKGKIQQFPFQSADSIHFQAASMQLAYLDRARYMGDPAFVRVPVKKLLSDEYLEDSLKRIDMKRHVSAEDISNAVPVLESSETTHLSIADADGNMVATTQTINGWFGSAMIAEGTGILLNNEMDDFAARAGASNLFGAIGSRANLVAPGKTPLSSMTPTLILEDEKPRMSLGAPGGTRIITCVYQTLLNYLVHGKTLVESISAKRIHHQWKPDRLHIEAPGLGGQIEADLKQRGWTLDQGEARCAVMAVAKEGESWLGVSEPRDHGIAIGH